MQKRKRPAQGALLYVVRTFRTGGLDLREHLAHLGGHSSNLLLVV
jgi:hypothetical protein